MKHLLILIFPEINIKRIINEVFINSYYFLKLKEKKKSQLFDTFLIFVK
jgi:hypothetical protein